MSNIIIINKSDRIGGAAIASFRLFQSLRKTYPGLSTKMLVQMAQSNEEDVENIVKGTLGKYYSLGLLALEKLLFLKHEKNADIRFQFSTAITGINLAGNKLLRNADLIHLNWFCQGFLSINGLRKIFQLNKPIVWTHHDMWAFTGGCHYTGDCKNYHHKCGNCPFLKYPKQNDISNNQFNKKNKLYNNSNLTLIAPSNWMAEKIKESALLKDFRLEVIPYPINSDIFMSCEKSEAKQKNRLDPTKKYILFGAANIFDERKGFKYFAKALSILADSNPNLINEIVLLTFGKSKGLIELPFKTHQLNYISGDLKLAELYQAADIYVLPTLEDNLPNMVIESLSCGTPVVAFNTGGIPDMIQHRKNGYLADYKSSEDLAKGIYEILFESNINKMSETARNFVLTNFSEKVIAQKHFDLYNELLIKQK
jgi:glycosyltransferase involved in cell wall biosynthesis